MSLACRSALKARREGHSEDPDTGDNANGRRGDRDPAAAVSEPRPKPKRTGPANDESLFAIYFDADDDSPSGFADSQADSLARREANASCPPLPEDPEARKALFTSLKKQVRDSTLRISRAEHHCRFLGDCLDKGVTPRGLQLSKSLNVMAGSAKEGFLTDISAWFDRCNKCLMHKLIHYYSELIYSEPAERMPNSTTSWKLPGKTLLARRRSSGGRLPFGRTRWRGTAAGGESANLLN